MWPESVQRVADFLRDARAEATLEELAQPTARAEDAARAVGAELDRIVKTLVCDCDGRTVVVLVPGDRRGDLVKVARAAGTSRARIVPADRVAAVTGFEPGAVAPFPLPGVSAVFVDQRLLAHPFVWVGAGSTNHLARLRPSELLRVTRGRSIDAVADATYDSP